MRAAPSMWWGAMKAARGTEDDVERLHAAVDLDVEDQASEDQEQLQVQPALAEEGGLLEDLEDAAGDDDGGAAVDDGAEAGFEAGQDSPAEGCSACSARMRDRTNRVPIQRMTPRTWKKRMTRIDSPKPERRGAVKRGA